MASHFLGLRTVVYAAPEIETTRDWYIRALGITPYFDHPFYVGFNVGGYELGLDPDAEPDKNGQGVYWGVADIDAALAHLESVGATLREPVQEVGDRIRVASVTDPFGNVVGLIENPHFALPA